jgi:hypothetical protein
MLLPLERGGGLCPPLALLQEMEEPNGRAREGERDGHGQPRQVALDDVGAALRGGSETHAAEAGVAAGVHQDQADQADREQHVKDRNDLEHKAQGTGGESVTSKMARINSAAIRSFVT